MHLFFRYKVQILLKAQYPIDIVLVSLIFSICPYISAPSNEHQNEMHSANQAQLIL